ncbi:MAG: RNA polymerase sigma factor [Actinomycetota bacterium]|nr:sigma-70 family RNA polymerase sigma factor [Actinomycetota bacterium]
MHIPDLEARSDAELVRAFVDEDDRDCLEILLKRHESKVYGLCYRVLGNRADALEATQETFINVFRKMASFKHQAAFTTWLYRLATNACYDYSRKRSREPVAMERIDEPSEGDLGDDVSERLGIEAALSQLIPEQRLAVILRDIGGLSYDEVASAMQVPVGTVKSRIARGRSALAGLLKSGGNRNGGASV